MASHCYIAFVHGTLTIVLAVVVASLPGRPPTSAEQTPQQNPT